MDNLKEKQTVVQLKKNNLTELQNTFSIRCRKYLKENEEWAKNFVEAQEYQRSLSRDNRITVIFTKTKTEVVLCNCQIRNEKKYGRFVYKGSVCVACWFKYYQIPDGFYSLEPIVLPHYKHYFDLRPRFHYC